jgi:transcriptional regulator with XRE-family HTH domain
MYHQGTKRGNPFCANMVKDVPRVKAHRADMARNDAPNRVRKLRTDADLTLEQLAERAGTSHTQISRIETGARPLTPNMAKRLGNALGVNPALLYQELPDDARQALAREAVALIDSMSPDNAARWIEVGRALARPAGTIGE